MEKRKKLEQLQGKWNRLKFTLVELSFIVPVIFILIRMLTGKIQTSDAGYHSTADYLLMIIQCLLGCVALHIPAIISKKLHFQIPGLMYGLYITFLYCAIFLGEVRSFYYRIPHWDTYLHGMSSLMTGFLGMIFISVLNRDEKVTMKLSPFFVALFAFSFSVMIGAVWEIYEYTFDGLLGLNMQKFMLVDGTVLQGHAALSDTMKDLIVDASGALIASVIGYFSVKNNATWYIPVLKQD